MDWFQDAVVVEILLLVFWEIGVKVPDCELFRLLFLLRHIEII